MQQQVISSGSLVLQKLLGLVGSVDVCLVSPVKRSMKKTLRNSTVCVNELQILLYETALVLNARFVYDHNLEILTTNHLLFGRKLYTSSSIQGNIGIKFILPKCVHQIIFHHDSKINTWLHDVNMKEKKNVTTEWHKTIDKWYTYNIWRKTALKQMDAWASSRIYKWPWWQN